MRSVRAFTVFRLATGKFKKVTVTVRVVIKMGNVWKDSLFKLHSNIIWEAPLPK